MLKDIFVFMIFAEQHFKKIKFETDTLISYAESEILSFNRPLERFVAVS